MEFFIFIFGIIALTIIAPLFLIMYFITKWREQRVLNTDEEAEIVELWQKCDTLDKRIENLEQILKNQ